VEVGKEVFVIRVAEETEKIRVTVAAGNKLYFFLLKHPFLWVLFILV
jgi:hypothetical protein